jgi:hypothetical protein
VVRTSPDPAGAARPKRLEMGAPWPNPARHRTVIRLALPIATRAHVDVFDSGGRLVRTLVARTLEAGVTPIDWGLDDHEGVALRSGLYWVRGVLGTEVRLQRLVIVR